MNELLQSVEEIAITIDVDGTILDVTANTGASDQRIDHSTLIGESVDAVFPVESAEELHDVIKRTRESGIGTFEYGVSRQAEIDSFSGRVIPINTDDEQSAVIWVAEDGTDRERREARMEIQQKNELLAQTEQLAAVGGWELDLESETLTWTEGTRRIHDVPSDYEPSRREAIGFYHPNDREKIRQATEQCREDGTPYDLEARIVTADGRTRWVRTSGHRITRDGRQYLQGAIRDVTERKNREQRLMVLYRVLRHNLRNALNVVTGHAGHIRAELQALFSPETNDDGGTIETFLDPQTRPEAGWEAERSAESTTAEVVDRLASFSEEAIRKDVRKIEETSDDLLELVEKTRAFERRYDGNGEWVAVSVRRILEDVRDVFKRRYPAASIDVVGPDATVEAQTGQLYPVVEELLENAIEHSDREHPSVTLRTEVDEPTVEAATESRRVLIKVEDSGPGIPEQERKAIERGVETSLVHATGLGLWHVYWVVTQLGGTLTFEDNEPRGTIVTVELPGSNENIQ